MTDKLDAMRAAPETHRVLFENEQVRVLAVRVRPGEFVPMHTHEWDMVTATVKGARFRVKDGEGNESEEEYQRGFEIYKGDLVPLGGTNISEKDYEAIVFEVKTPLL